MPKWLAHTNVDFANRIMKSKTCIFRRFKAHCSLIIHKHNYNIRIHIHETNTHSNYSQATNHQCSDKILYIYINTNTNFKCDLYSLYHKFTTNNNLNQNSLQIIFYIYIYICKYFQDNREAHINSHSETCNTKFEINFIESYTTRVGVNQR